MRAFVAFVALTTWGCGFQPGTFEDSPDDTDSSPDAGASVGTPGADAGLSTTPRLPCAFPDPELRLCVEFEDRTFTPLVTDASPMRLDATPTEITERAHGSRFAAQFASTSRLAIPESPALDFTTALTIEMWVYPSWPQPVNLLTNTGQYRIQIDGGGRVGCQLPNAQVWSAEEHSLVPLAWAHIACSYKPGGVLTVYVDGFVAARETSANPGLTGAGTQGTTLGETYAGGIDDIRIYGRALSDKDVCTHAGRTSCQPD